MRTNGIDSWLIVVIVGLLVGVGYLVSSYASPGFLTFLAIIFGPAALLLVIWGLARLSAS